MDQYPTNARNQLVVLPEDTTAEEAINDHMQRMSFYVRFMHLEDRSNTLYAFLDKNSNMVCEMVRESKLPID